MLAVEVFDGSHLAALSMGQGMQHIVWSARSHYYGIALVWKDDSHRVSSNCHAMVRVQHENT